jgi:hypothetical protein
MHMGVTEQIIFHLDNMMYLIYFFKKIESEISNTICVNYFFFPLFFFDYIFFKKKIGSFINYIMELSFYNYYYCYFA